jgi:hypothetical protein
MARAFEPLACWGVSCQMIAKKGTRFVTKKKIISHYYTSDLIYNTSDSKNIFLGSTDK